LEINQEKSKVLVYAKLTHFFVPMTFENVQKCGKEVAPKKTWKMAGKPDKTGKRMQLEIGLCECRGKTFRTVLNEQKI
jgi:hypothetical protein